MENDRKFVETVAGNVGFKDGDGHCTRKKLHARLKLESTLGERVKAVEAKCHCLAKLDKLFVGQAVASPHFNSDF